MSWLRQIIHTLFSGLVVSYFIYSVCQQLYPATGNIVYDQEGMAEKQNAAFHEPFSTESFLVSTVAVYLMKCCLCSVANTTHLVFLLHFHPLWPNLFCCVLSRQLCSVFRTAVSSVYWRIIHFRNWPTVSPIASLSQILLRSNRPLKPNVFVAETYIPLSFHFFLKIISLNDNLSLPVSQSKQSDVTLPSPQNAFFLPAF